jgi:hypothetical protein
MRGTQKTINKHAFDRFLVGSHRRVVYVLPCVLHRVALRQTQFDKTTCGPDSPQAAQDRRAGAYQRAAHQFRYAFGLAPLGRIRRGPPQLINAAAR